MIPVGGPVCFVEVKIMTTGTKLSCTSLQEHNLKTFTRVPHAVGLVVAYHRRIEQLYAGDPETGLAACASAGRPDKLDSADWPITTLLQIYCDQTRPALIY
jgi:hypothetical protein